MHIRKIRIFKERIIYRLFRVIYWLENIANTNWQTNGEKDFINNVVKYYENKRLVVFDVGANIGEYSDILIGLLNGKIDYALHLFEPQKCCIEDLHKKFANNNKVTLNNFGLSNENEMLTLYKNEEKSELGSLYKRKLDFYNIKMEKQEKVSLQRAEDYIVSNKIEKINLLKIDVEGHELKAFAGFGKFLNPDFIDFIQFEYGGANMDSHTNLLDLYEVLTSKGFKICKIMHGYLELRDYNPRYDNFVYQNYVAVSKNVFANLRVK